MRFFLRAAILAVIVFAIDQASKWWVIDAFAAHGAPRMEIAPFLDFVLQRNTGVNFGLFASTSQIQQFVLTGFAFCVSVALFYWSWITHDARVAVGCGLLIGGALGNAVDRLRYGGVIDFINMDCCGIGNPYAFNIADAAIFFGAAAIVLSSWSRPDDAAQEEKGPAAETR